MKQEWFRFTSGDHTSNMRPAGGAGEASPAAATSQHSFLLQQWERDGNTLIWSLPVTGFLFLALFCLACEIMQRDALLNKSRHLVRQLRRSTRTSGAWCRQRRKRAKVAVRERSDRTVLAHPHHARVFLLHTCLFPFISHKRLHQKKRAGSQKKSYFFTKFW